MNLNVLFTSAGRRVELVRSFRAAYEHLPFHGSIVCVDIDPLAPALSEADSAYLVPRLTSLDYITTIVEVCRREQIQLVFPLIDPDIPVLATHRSAIEGTGARIAVVSVEATEITSDKWKTTHFFANIGLPTPRSWLPGQVAAEELSYPVFIKPRRGSAAQNTFQVHAPHELAFFSTYIPDPIIQEYLPGPEITSDVICDLNGKVLAVVSRRRIEVRGGEVTKGVTIYNPDIVEACMQIAHALPAIGPITVQCMMKDGVPHFTEINARLGGGAPLAIAAGVDFPRLLLASVSGTPITLPSIGSYKTGIYMTRFDDSHFLTEKQRESLASHNL